MHWTQSRAQWATKRQFVVLLISTIGATACAEPEVRSSQPVTWEEFVERVSPATGRPGYIVDRDVYVADLDALRTYYEAYLRQAGSMSQPGESAVEQALTVGQVNGLDDIWKEAARFTLTYCISNGFGADLARPKNKQAVIDALTLAGRSWDSIVNVRFSYISAQDANCTSSNTNIAFNVTSVSGTGFFASAFFPKDARQNRQLQIDDTAFTTTTGGRDLQGIMRHELGHVLGFRHEHIWLMPQCSAEAATDARQVTSYDVNSVMHYPQCRPSGTGGYRQSQADYGGATALYGVAPALIMASQLTMR